MAPQYDTSAQTAQVPLTMAETEQIAANGRRALPDEKALLHFLGRVVATLRAHKRQVTDLQRDVDSLRSQLASAHPAQAAEQALAALTDQQRAVVLDRYVLARAEEFERATDAAERARVAALSEINRVRFALNELLADPGTSEEIKARLAAALKQMNASGLAPSALARPQSTETVHAAPVTDAPVAPSAPRAQRHTQKPAPTAQDILDGLFEQ